MRKQNVNIVVFTKSEFQQGRTYLALEKFNMRLVDRERKSRMVYEANVTLGKLVKVLKVLRKEQLEFMIQRGEA